MLSVYERLAAAFDPDDEPHISARRSLKVLLIPDETIRGSGIDETVWRKTIQALVASADKLDLEVAQAAAGHRRKAWLQMRPALERTGCHLWCLSDDTDQWRIDGPGVHLEIDLASGEIEGLPYGPVDMSDTFCQLVEIVEGAVAGHRQKLEQKARVAELRKAYNWDGPRKVWVPKSGAGATVPGGGWART